jgi:cell division protein FtsN
MIKRLPSLALLFLAILSLGGCSDNQEADVVELPAQSDDVRRVVFDKEGVVEIHEGDRRVFAREQDQSDSLPASPMPEADELDEQSESSRLAVNNSDSAASGEKNAPSASQATPIQASHVPPKLTPTALAAEPLSRATTAMLEPLPAKVAPPVPTTTYGVQVGFFGQRSNAENLRDVLTNNDWPVKLIKIDKKNGNVFYLVVVPVRGNRERASTAKTKIQTQHRLDGIVIRMDSLPS